MNAGGPEALVFLVDVDNTLIDNDGVRARLDDAIMRVVGGERAGRFWEIYEEVRAELDHVDFPATMERFGRECDDVGRLGTLAELLNDFPFPECLYPEALAALAHLETLGTTVILSDGDQLYQRAKIRSAGIEAAVGGRVLVYVHKEEELADVRRRYPARHYALLDDKPRIHVAMKQALGVELTTVLLRQGKYAREDWPAGGPPADLELAGIAEARTLTVEQVLGAAPGARGG